MDPRERMGLVRQPVITPALPTMAPHMHMPVRARLAHRTAIHVARGARLPSGAINTSHPAPSRPPFQGARVHAHKPYIYPSGQHMGSHGDERPTPGEDL